MSHMHALTCSKRRWLAPVSSHLATLAGSVSIMIRWVRRSQAISNPFLIVWISALSTLDLPIFKEKKSYSQLPLEYLATSPMVVFWSFPITLTSLLSLTQVRGLLPHHSRRGTILGQLTFFEENLLHHCQAIHFIKESI